MLFLKNATQGIKILPFECDFYAMSYCYFCAVRSHYEFGKYTWAIGIECIKEVKTKLKNKIKQKPYFM